MGGSSPGIPEYVERIKNLFLKADKEALKKAIEKKDFTGTCEVLGVSEEEYRHLLKSGLDITKKMFSARTGLEKKSISSSKQSNSTSIDLIHNRPQPRHRQRLFIGPALWIRLG
jgi:hypothetical protein